MSVRITESTGPYALYDSVTGIAFGEVFESQYDAEEFLTHMQEFVLVDPRTLSPHALREYRLTWDKDRT